MNSRSSSKPAPATAGLEIGSSTDVVGTIETVMVFNHAMPTGVSVSDEGRIFVNYPRWGDPVPFTVAELKDGREIPFPNPEINRLDVARAEDAFVSVQSIVVDPRNRLWVLDTGSLELQRVVPAGPKLVGIDLRTNRVVKRIRFGADVVLPTTYLNDVRFDLRHGDDGIAYITDSSAEGPNGIIVVDLATGASWRRLHDHPSTKAEANFVPRVEGKPFMQRKPGEPPKPITMGADGIAISSDGERIFYCALAARRLFSVSAEHLRDRHVSDDVVAATVRDEGPKAASDGLETDGAGRIYVTDYEHNAIHRREIDGHFETLVCDPRMLWPDTLSLAADGYLYFTANQLHRQPMYQSGEDRRVKPYALYRVRVDADPVRLE